jgi:hypothetical protein
MTESQTKRPDVFRQLFCNLGVSVRLFARSPVIPKWYIAGFAERLDMMSRNTFGPLFHIFNNLSCTVIAPLGTLEEDQKQGSKQQTKIKQPGIKIRNKKR